MGRPLNKKYFGNKNFGSPSTLVDDGLGGSTVTGLTVGTAGTYTVAGGAPTITFPDPALKVNGSVTAAGTPTFRVVSATISGGSNYGNAQTFDLTVNTAAGSAVLNVTSTAGGAITTVNSITTAGVFTGISAVTSVSGGAGTGATPVLTYGLLSATMTEIGSGYLSAVVGTTTITATTAPQTATAITSTIANNILTVTAVTGTILNNMILTGGSVTAGAYVVNQILPLTGSEATGGIGRYYIEKYQGGAISGTPTTGTLNAITVASTVEIQPGMTFTAASTVGGLTGSTTYYVISQLGPNTVQVGTTVGATASVTLTTTTAQSVVATFGQFLGVTVSAGAATATAALSPIVVTNTGTTSSNTGIRMTAFLEAADGGKAARQLSDIVKQVSGTRYKVENQDGIGIVRLTSGTITAGTGIITATDSAGGTYLVIKLTNRKATIVPRTGTQFPLNADSTPQQIQWTLGTPTLNVSVQIDNG
jgi:hypothetical protein